MRRARCCCVPERNPSGRRDDHATGDQQRGRGAYGDVSQSVGRRGGDDDRWRDVRRGNESAGWASCGGRRVDEGRHRGDRCDTDGDARTVPAPRTHPTVHRRDRRRRCGASGRRDRGSGPACRRPWHRRAARCRSRGECGCALGGGHGAVAPLRHPPADGSAVRRPQACADRRRTHSSPRRGQPVDHRSAGTCRRAPPAGPRRRRARRRWNGPGRRSVVDGASRRRT